MECDMSSFPLIHILFWIALMTAPHGASHITISGPDKSWTWTKQESGWIQSTDHSVWTNEGNTIIRKSGEKTDQQDVTEFVKGITVQDWGKTASLKLGPMTSLTKTGDSFVYILNEGDPTEKRYVIEFKKK